MFPRKKGAADGRRASLGPSSFELCCCRALPRCTERCPLGGHQPGLPKLPGLRNAGAVPSPLPRENLNPAAVHERRWRRTREPAAVKRHEGKRQAGRGRGSGYQL